MRAGENELFDAHDITWRPKDAPEALAALEELGRRFREKDDQRAVFVDVYVVITRKVVHLMGVEDHAGFLDPNWLSELTGRFAEEALVAALASLKSQPIRCSAWRFANHYSARKLTAPFQDALLGVSAHINYDLGLVVYDFLASRRAWLNEERLERYRCDYIRVNKILEASVFECMDLLVERYNCQLTRRLARVPFSRPVIAYAVMKTLEIWRNRVWDDIMRLLQAPDEATRRKIVAQIDRRAGRIAQAICSRSLPPLWLKGERPPVRLSTPAGAWPNVRPDTPSERTITDTVLVA